MSIRAFVTACLCLAACGEPAEPAPMPEFARPLPPLPIDVAPAHAHADAPAPAAEPAAPPRLLVVEPDSAEERAECWFDVVEIGLPAVREDGGALAVVEYDATGDAAGHVGGSDFVTHDLHNVEGSDRRRLADDAFDRAGTEHDGPLDRAERLACRRYERRLRQRVDRFNAELADYRPLQKLDVVVVDPARIGVQDPSSILPARRVPEPLRPVEAAYRDGWFTVRVPGLRVLTTQAELDWRVAEGFCDADPHIDDVYGDRTTGVGLVAVNHASGARLCDEDEQTFHPVDVPASVFEELDRRPSERYWSLVDALATS